MELKDANVLVLGVTYRGDVKDTLNSPAISIIGHLTNQCPRVYAYDPLMGDEVGQYGAKVVSDLLEVGEGFQIDAVVIASDHSEFKDIDWHDFGGRMRHKVIVDGRHCIDVVDMRHEGWAAYGIGR
jgi:UDP-N-acetyl-D-mannosaminuronic acid dehydrogenase